MERALSLSKGEGEGNDHGAVTVEDVRAYVEGLGGVLTLAPGPGDGTPELAWGDLFFYEAPDGVVPPGQPFATVVTKDYPGEPSSGLGDGSFRVNVGAGAEEFGRWARDGTGDVAGPSARDVVMAHPTYAAQRWLCVVDPGPGSWPALQELLASAHARARGRRERRERAGRRGSARRLRPDRGWASGQDGGMPEGDTVWLACRQLNAALAGRVLTRCELRVPQLATTDFTGVEVREVVSRGKHQLTRFANGWTLHTHLRMDGGWRVYPTGRRWTGGPAWQIRVLMVNAEAAAVGYRLPVTEMVRTDAEDSVVGHIGPDLLGPDWDADEALRRIRSDPDRTIGEALLNQRNLAGIGTLYRAETLFLQGVHPRTPVAQVKDLPRVVARAKMLLEANKNIHDQITTGNRRLGSHWVFERPGQDCRRCGTKIETEEFGPPGVERRSYWCPHCQPLRS